MKFIKKRRKETIKPINIVETFCIDSVETMQIMDESEYKLYDKMTNYLMNEKIYHFTESEAKYLIYFFAKFGMYKLDKDLEKQVKIKIVGKEKMEELECGKSKAVCCYNESGISTIFYSDQVVNEIMSDDIEQVADGIKIVFHETVHAYYNKLMKTDCFELNPLYATKTYIIALENLIRDISEEYYSDNYKVLIQENEAERMAIISLVNVFKKYNKEINKILNVDVLKKRIKNYQEAPCKNSRKLLGIVIKKGYNLPYMEFVAKKILVKEPGYLEKYPILKIAYNENGTRKSISQLLEDREKRMQRKNATSKSINDLFYFILNNRITSEDEDYNELEELSNYNECNEKKDVFLENLIRSRLIRMSRKKEKSGKNNSHQVDFKKNIKNLDEKLKARD